MGEVQSINPSCSCMFEDPWERNDAVSVYMDALSTCWMLLGQGCWKFSQDVGPNQAYPPNH